MVQRNGSPRRRGLTSEEEVPNREEDEPQIHRRARSLERALGVLGRESRWDGGRAGGDRLGASRRVAAPVGIAPALREPGHGSVALREERQHDAGAGVGGGYRCSATSQPSLSNERPAVPVKRASRFGLERALDQVDLGRVVDHLERELRHSLLIVRIGGLPLEREGKLRRGVDLPKGPGQLERLALGRAASGSGRSQRRAE